MLLPVFFSFRPFRRVRIVTCLCLCLCRCRCRLSLFLSLSETARSHLELALRVVERVEENVEGTAAGRDV